MFADYMASEYDMYELLDYAPKRVFESPFLNADWNSGIVTISKGDRTKVLDFEREN